MSIPITAIRILAGEVVPEMHRRRRLRFIQTGFIVVLLCAAAGLRDELLTINGIDVAAACRVPEELPEERVLRGGRGQEPRLIYPRWLYEFAFTHEFDECRDRFAGLVLEPARRRSCFDAARDEGQRSCEAQLAELSNRYGASRVFRALQWRYGSSEQIAKYYILKIWEVVMFVVVLAGPAIAGAVFVTVVVKSIN